MNKILIITTKGCEACEIAKRNLEIAILQCNADVTIETKDYNDVDKYFLKKNGVKDYPTVFYIVDDKVSHKAIGSFPSAVYLRWMDMYFKN